MSESAKYILYHVAIIAFLAVIVVSAYSTKEPIDNLIDSNKKVNDDYYDALDGLKQSYEEYKSER